MRDATYHEKALVGLAVLDPSVLDRCGVDLIGYAWTDELSGRFWNILLRMRERGEPIGDVRAVLESSRPFGIESSHIAEFASDAGVKGSDPYHVEQILEHQALSRLRGIAGQIMNRLQDPKAESSKIREWVSSQLSEASPRTLLPKSASQLIDEIIIDTVQKTSTPPIDTGLSDLDCCIGGLRAGQLAILAARPSIGKSAMGSQIAINVAKQNHTVLFISLEMSSKETVSRLLAADEGIPITNALDGCLSSDEIKKAEGLRDAYRPVPLFIEDKRGLSIDQIEQLIRATSSRRKLGLVVIDYLGLIAYRRELKRWEAIGEVTARLKTIAQTEKIPILALCQLSRMAEGERPELSHLRDSGSIEQDADIVLLLHRESRQGANTELFVAKARNGSLGRIELSYHGPRFKFESVKPVCLDELMNGGQGWAGSQTRGG